MICHSAKPWCGQEIRSSLKRSQHWKNDSPNIGENWEIWRLNASVLFSGKNFFKNSPCKIGQEWIESGLNELNHILAVSLRQKGKSLRKKISLGQELSITNEHASSPSIKGHPMLDIACVQCLLSHESNAWYCIHPVSAISSVQCLILPVSSVCYLMRLMPVIACIQCLLICMRPVYVI